MERKRFEVDLWHRKPARGKATRPLVFVCAYDVFIGIDSIGESAWMCRRSGSAELWTDGDYLEYGLSVVDHDPPDDDLDAAEALIDLRVRAGRGHGVPTGCIRDGLIDAAHFERILARIQAEEEETRQKALENRAAPILVACRELGLHLEPTPDHPDYWEATCPGTNHRLMLKGSTSEFYCGYCKREGGPEDLRQFVKARRRRSG